MEDLDEADPSEDPHQSLQLHIHQNHQHLLPLENLTPQRPPLTQTSSNQEHLQFHRQVSVFWSFFPSLPSQRLYEGGIPHWIFLAVTDG